MIITFFYKKRIKIKTSILEKAVLESIQLQVKLVIELERSMNKLFFKNNKDSLENEYKNNVRLAEMKINNLKEQKRESYEGCMPVEVMAKRGLDTLRFGPLKPVGFDDPRTGKRLQ